MIDPLSAQRLKEFIKQEYGTIREASKDSGRSEQILAKMVRGEIDIQEGVLKGFQRKKRLNLNWIYTGILPMILGEKDTKRTTLTDVGELKTTVDHLRGQQAYYKKIFSELLDRSEANERKISDMEENVKMLNSKVNEQAMEIKFLKSQLS